MSPIVVYAIAMACGVIIVILICWKNPFSK